ncbi:glycosyltransferase [Defluviimonas sp. WL0002]|uniref:Glycosyltransferase n=1 Tax=Albidovulum marisflavi TaxID=2984159 RepID=A0ABT2Z935_9RHOB|nr:glycosyltransferase [Defluviimonas sp. WL0002]MCV2867645.1 glycosyltransferase [Defluviimonas sp. WL0002]
MRILFIHQNFPGQFLHLAPALAGRGHDVLALTDAGNTRPRIVRTLCYPSPDRPEVSGLARTYARACDRGLRVARACAALDARGYRPDVIFAHGGWGEPLFLRDVWPGVRILTYAEFLYRSTGLDAGFDAEFQTADLSARNATTARKAHLLMALQDADAAVSPTEFQASTFPKPLRSRITVIHDGVDTDVLRPDPGARFDLPGGRVLRPGDEVLSLVARKLEPYRGYHVFMRALPAVMAARPEAQVVIVGAEGQSYGGPPATGTWKDRFLAEVRDRIDPSRLHFAGRIPYPKFTALMQVTRAHAYLTYPFVLSWSMIEAMAAGALVVGSATPPVEEVIRNDVNGRLVPFFDVEGWSRSLISALADPAGHLPLRRAARETAVARFDLRTVCLPRLVAFVEGANRPAREQEY